MSNPIALNSCSLIHHGAASGVTGSCHELRLGRDSLLIDCGQFQGEAGPARLDVAPARVRAVLLTHAHIDHIGRLPELLAAGLTAPIYCSEATALLVPVMLEDALRHTSGGQRLAIDPLLQRLRHQLRPLPFAQWQRLSLSDGAMLYVRLQPAGHILGSAYLELRLSSGEVVVFSGDLGSGRSALLAAPLSPERADLLVLESTYGDRVHPHGEPRHRQLKAIVERSLRDGGAIADHGAHEALVHRLQQSGEPAIIVAGGGMCQGGRIVNYLQALLPDARTDLLLAGFQAQGTPGRLLQSGCSSLWLDGVEVRVAAQIHSLSGYSAHADQQELLTFVQGMRSPPRAIRLVHGEPAAQQALALKLAGLCSEALLSCACKP